MKYIGSRRVVYYDNLWEVPAQFTQVLRKKLIAITYIVHIRAAWKLSYKAIKLALITHWQRWKDACMLTVMSINVGRWKISDPTFHTLQMQHSLEARLAILVLLYLPVHNYKCTGTSTQSLFLSAERITTALTSLMIYILTWLWSWQPYNSRVQPILTAIMIICLLLIKRSLHWGPGMLQVNSLEATGQQHLYVAILN